MHSDPLFITRTHGSTLASRSNRALQRLLLTLHPVLPSAHTSYAVGSTVTSSSTPSAFSRTFNRSWDTVWETHKRVRGVDMFCAFLPPLPSPSSSPFLFFLLLVFSFQRLSRILLISCTPLVTSRAPVSIFPLFSVPMSARQEKRVIVMEETTMGRLIEVEICYASRFRSYACASVVSF